MNPILKRSLCALTAAAIVVALFLYCPLTALAPVLIVLSALVQWEFYALARTYEPVTAFGLLMGTLWLAATAVCPVNSMGILHFLLGVPVFFTVSFFALALFVLFSPRYARPIGTLAVTWAGFFYVPFMISFFLRVVQTAGPAALADGAWFAMPGTRAGLYALFALLAATKVSDMGGFAFGLSFGRHKMCPSVSPKKSWEGFAGSVFGACLMTFLFTWLAGRENWGEACGFWRFVSWPVALAAGALIATFGTLGDLVESRFKRECGIKDSGGALPAGMGGFLDMFDSILFIPALAYPFMCYAHWLG